MSTNTNRASDELRRANAKAIRQRGQWRERYAVLSQSIRKTKARLQAAQRSAAFDRAAEIELYALRYAADGMMLQRAMIKQDLYDSAYEYMDTVTA